ncbi:Uncharacterised protein [Legionella beliardensis]|uniref:Uncharacterized protein n=1 Tax=Legionella beliardensis TaxID=91822 RepID=A0A378I0U6_9GAMM|nr:hypothetical protein [Legionella beliardensis]STX28592.1 Uncharacterised protein [Legionella beliardensis]
MKHSKKFSKVQKNQIIDDSDLEQLSGGQATTRAAGATLKLTPERGDRTVRDSTVRTSASILKRP